MKNKLLNDSFFSYYFKKKNRIFLFVIVGLFLSASDAQVYAQQNKTKHTNSLIMLIGEDFNNILHDPLYWLFQKALKSRSAPIICTVGYISKWLIDIYEDACEYEKKKNTRYEKTLRSFYREISHWRFYRFKKNNLFLCLRDDEATPLALYNDQIPDFLQEIDFSLGRKFVEDSNSIELKSDLKNLPVEKFIEILKDLESDSIIVRKDRSQAVTSPYNVNNLLDVLYSYKSNVDILTTYPYIIRQQYAFNLESINKIFDPLKESDILSKNPWNIIWVGHGIRDSAYREIKMKSTGEKYYTNTLIGNTDIQTLQEALALFQRIGTESLLIVSCYSGGKNRDYIRPKCGATSYPIALLSASEQAIRFFGEENFKDYFDLLGNKKTLDSKSLFWFENAITRLIDITHLSAPTNIPLIKPPHHDNFYFFLPPYNLNRAPLKADTGKEKMQMYYGGILKNSIVHSKQENKNIIFDGKCNVAVYPEIIDVPIEIIPLFVEDKANVQFPVITSLRQGNAFHLFKEITLHEPHQAIKSFNAKEFSDNFFTRQEYPKINNEKEYAEEIIETFLEQSFMIDDVRLSNKTFFIKKITCNKNILENVLIKTNPGQSWDLQSKEYRIKIIYMRGPLRVKKTLIKNYKNANIINFENEISPEHALKLYKKYTETASDERNKFPKFTYTNKKIPLLEDIYENSESSFDMHSLKKNHVTSSPFILDFFDYYDNLKDKEQRNLGVVELHKKATQKENDQKIFLYLNQLKNQLACLREKLSLLKEKLILLDLKLREETINNLSLIEKYIFFNKKLYSSLLINVQDYELISSAIALASAQKYLENQDNLEKIIWSVLLNEYISFSEKKYIFEHLMSNYTKHYDYEEYNNREEFLDDIKQNILERYLKYKNEMTALSPVLIKNMGAVLNTIIIPKVFSSQAKTLLKKMYILNVFSLSHDAKQEFEQLIEKLKITFLADDITIFLKNSSYEKLVLSLDLVSHLNIKKNDRLERVYVNAIAQLKELTVEDFLHFLGKYKKLSTIKKEEALIFSFLFNKHLQLNPEKKKKVLKNFLNENKTKNLLSLLSFATEQGQLDSSHISLIDIAELLAYVLEDNSFDEKNLIKIKEEISTLLKSYFDRSQKSFLISEFEYLFEILGKYQFNEIQKKLILAIRCNNFITAGLKKDLAEKYDF